MPSFAFRRTVIAACAFLALWIAPGLGSSGSDGSLQHEPLASVDEYELLLSSMLSPENEQAPGIETADMALLQIAAEIQKDESMVRDLVSMLLKNENNDCFGGDGNSGNGSGEQQQESAHDFHLIGSHRVLQTSTDLFKDLSNLKRDAKKIKKSLGLSKIDLNKLAVDFTSLRDFVLANSGKLNTLEVSISVGIDTISNLIADLSSNAASTASTLDSLKVLVGTYSFNVDSLSVAIDSQQASVQSLNTAVQTLSDVMPSLQLNVSSLTNGEFSTSSKLQTFVSQISDHNNRAIALNSSVTSSSKAASELEKVVAPSSSKLQCIADTPLSQNTLTFSGCNVFVENGVGSTTSVNGRGNLIVGNNEEGECTADNVGGPIIDCRRGGSHNLVLGMQNQYPNFGGIVAGSHNTISSDYATVTAGYQSKALALGSAVSGGSSHRVSATTASVSGGLGNRASGSASVVSGGAGNFATADVSTVVGSIGLHGDTEFVVLPY